jgi:hypothetical protein
MGRPDYESGGNFKDPVLLRTSIPQKGRSPTESNACHQTRLSVVLSLLLGRACRSQRSGWRFEFSRLRLLAQPGGQRLGPPHLQIIEAFRASDKDLRGVGFVRFTQRAAGQRTLKIRFKRRLASQTRAVGYVSLGTRRTIFTRIIQAGDGPAVS